MANLVVLDLGQGTARHLMRRLTPHDGFGRRPSGKGTAPLSPRPTAHLTLATVS